MTPQTATFQENSIIVTVTFKPRQEKLGREVLEMCKTLDDVQRCASMGDFTLSYNIKEA
jgi:hypothetical protein